MKELLTLLLIPLACCMFSCIPIVIDHEDCDEDNPYTEYEQEVLNFPASPYHSVAIETENGEIKSSTSDSDYIRVELNLWATGETAAEAEAHIQDIEVIVDEDSISGRLSIWIRMPDHTNRGYGCAVTLILPEDLFVDLKTYNGLIQARGHESGINALSYNGKLTLEDTAGEANLITYNGRIMVDHHRGNIVGETLNGEIEARVDMPDNYGICTFTSSNGKIYLAVPDTVGAMITLRTANGTISVDPGLPTQPDSNPDDNIYESVMGNGSGTIYARSYNGDVTLAELH
ncbi:DUF4097 domain-containing protein [candidate division CSSED10-310 bacterium]|uniref:DUF4097 domain-containing protein n=1 Tax=candidate division CSSED10-310 bacterium TaxID=2855610 RepID=A0ABV6Z003_UNCC1